MTDEDRVAPPPPAADDDAGEGAGATLEVTLPSFHGPLDLLLHLLKKNEIDIYDIPIVPITEQYTAYLDAMDELNLEVAADYIYMAAVLIHIKSQMLLPRDENAEGQQEDPRAELVNRLLEYQRFKQVAETFAELDIVRMGVWPRPAVKLPESEAAEIDMSEVSLFDLIDSAASRCSKAIFSAIFSWPSRKLRSTKHNSQSTTSDERTPRRTGSHSFRFQRTRDHRGSRRGAGIGR